MQNNIVYNNSTLDSIKNKGNFIQTYFKNTEISNNKNDKSNVKTSLPSNGSYKENLDAISVKRNSKSNMQLRKDQMKDFNMMSDTGKQKSIPKAQRYLQDRHKFTK